MRTIKVEVPDWCEPCRFRSKRTLFTDWKWTCPFRQRLTGVSLDIAKPVKACRDAEIGRDRQNG